MDFSWSEEEIHSFNEACQFARQKFNSTDETSATPIGSFSREQWNDCGKFGVLGLCVPKEYGGQGLNALASARTLEALATGGADMGLLFAASAHLFASTMPIVKFGNFKMKQALLPSLSSGNLIGANAITEEHAGSDVYALKTVADKQGDYYILNGTKSFVTNGPIADVLTVYAVTNPNHSHLGITAFAIEANIPGIKLSKTFMKMGLNTAQGGWIEFYNCRIHQENRLGEEGQGAHIFHTSMLWERACLFASYLGMMERQLQKTIQYTRQRKQFGKAISKQQVVAHRLADMKLRLEAARLLLYRACWSLDKIDDPTLEIALSKLAVSEAAIQSSLDAIQLHGGYGYKSESGIEQMLRDAIPATIFSGTSEIQRNLIARELGL